MFAMNKPLLSYDGDCSFCLFWLAQWRRVIGDRIDYAPYHEIVDRFPEIPVEHHRRAVHLFEPDGQVTEGAEAVFRALSLAPGHRHWLWAYHRVPGARWVFDTGYRFIARHRAGLYKVTRWTYGEDQMKRPLEASPVSPRGKLPIVLGVTAGAVLLWWVVRRRPRSAKK